MLNLYPLFSFSIITQFQIEQTQVFLAEGVNGDKDFV